MDNNLSVWVVYDTEANDLWTSPKGKWNFASSQAAHQTLYKATSERANKFDSRYIIKDRMEVKV